MSQTQPLPGMKQSRNLDEINKRLKELRNSKVNLVGPGVRSLVKMETLPDSYEVAWHAFIFDSNPDGPHVYHDRRWEDGKLALKREALLELWISADGKYVHSQRDDDGKDPHYARYTWAGSALSLSGQPLLHSATKETDLREGSAQSKAMAKASNAMLSQQRSDISTITESKAQNRVIRALLDISHIYNQEQVGWPFVLMKLVFVPDMKDPLTRFLVTAHAIGASNMLFGGPTGAALVQQLLTAKTEPDDDDERAALPPGQAKSLGTGEETPKESGNGKLPFEISEPAKPELPKPLQTILSIADYEKLEMQCDIKTGKATPEMLAALLDLKTRNPERVLAINAPMEDWPPVARRAFVEKLLQKA